MHWIVLLLATQGAMALLLWAGGGDQRSYELWQWDASFRLVPGLPYLWLATAGLFTVLSFMAYLLFTTPAGAIRLRWWASAAIVLLVATAVRVAVLRNWTPTLATDLAAAGPEATRTWRLWLTVADLVAITCLIAALVLAGRSVWWAALYAWHPLVLVELANGHRDMLAVAALPAVVLILWFLRESLGDRPRMGTILTAVTAGLAALLAFVAFLAPLTGGWPAVPESTGLVANLLYRRWHLFDPSHVRLELWILFLLGLAAVLAVGIRRRLSPAQLLAHGLMVGLLCTPAPQAWQALWPLVLLPLAWSRATWVLSIAACGLWVVNVIGYVPDWLLLVGWLPVVVLEVVQLAYDAAGGAKTPCFSLAPSIT